MNRESEWTMAEVAYSAWAAYNRTLGVPLPSWLETDEDTRSLFALSARRLREDPMAGPADLYHWWRELNPSWPLFHQLPVTAQRGYVLIHAAVRALDHGTVDA